jgi:hypothetical protein
MALFSHDNHYILMIGDDGRFRSLEWTPDQDAGFSLPYESLNDVNSSPDGRFFAVIHDK